MVFGPRERILRAGIDLFTTRDFYNTTLAAIHSKAGVSVNTFYRYFQDKEQLVNEIYRTLRDHFEAALERAKDGESAGAVSAVFHCVWTEMATYHRTYPGIVPFLDRQFGRHYLDRESRTLSRVPKPITELITRLQQEKIAKDLPASLLAAAVWGTFLELIKVGPSRRPSLSDEDASAAEQCAWDAIRAAAPEDAIFGDADWSKLLAQPG